jgi:hypothetical protein
MIVLALFTETINQYFYKEVRLLSLWRNQS